MSVRRDYAFGPQIDYLDDPHVVGWRRAGDAEHPQGMAVVLSDGPGGSKRMNVSRPNRVFRDVAGTLTSGADGAGSFAAPTARCPSGLSSLEAQAV